MTQGKPAEEVNDSKLVNVEISPNTQQKEMNGHQMEEKLQEVWEGAATGTDFFWGLYINRLDMSWTLVSKESKG